MSSIKKIGQLLDLIHQRKPIVHHITNYVTVNDCANIVLAIGGSPIMADDIDEIEEITAISSALVLNIGTLNKRTIESMVVAGKKANALHIPVILDPVGAGASKLRNQATMRLLEEVQISILRGNMSEIRFAAGLEAESKGVDVSDTDMIMGEDIGRIVAESAAKKYNCVAAITGATDIISDGTHTLLIKNGTKHLSYVTGTGCMCTSLVGAFCGVTTNMLSAAAGGILSMGIAGELACESGGMLGTGSLHISIIDEISKLTPEKMIERAMIYES